MSTRSPSKKGEMKRAKGSKNGLIPNSLRIISSCLKTVSTNAGTVASTFRSAGASVAASVAEKDNKDQVLWAGFDKLELSPSLVKNVLLLGYTNGFQVLEVEDAYDVRELVSKHDGAVSFLQMQPIPAQSESADGFRSSHPMLLVVAADESNNSASLQGGHLVTLVQNSGMGSHDGSCTTPTTVRFFSLRSNTYVHVLRFRSAVYIIRCSPRVIAVALKAQIYCFNPATLESKFSVLIYPIQGAVGTNVGYGPMAVGARWLAYASNNPLVSNSGRLSPQNLTPSPGVSPSTSPGSGSFVARYAMESSKHLAAGIVNLGDMGYKTISKYCQDLFPDGSTSPVSPSSGRKVGRLLSSTHPNEGDNAGMVVIKDYVSRDIISQFRAHSSQISALCFDPSGTLLVTASINGNNINIFRIMPKYVSSGSGFTSYDWSSSHVHLYKLHRGLTPTIVQDICFSSFSQWISIVSSRGTCHVYLLSPFGGDASLQAQSISGGRPVLVPSISLPWWSTPTKIQQFCPPPTVTLSVVSRIRNGNSGWLNAVSAVAASAAGKIPAPSGTVAAVFHNTMHGSSRESNSMANPLEHLLVYSPSGHVIQHELRPSEAEVSDSSSRIGSTSHFPVQDEELRINAEPLQWWDVCRRSNWPERFESLSGRTLDNHETSDLLMEISDTKGNKGLSSTAFFIGESMKAHEKISRYLSNAEVKSSSGQIPIWQKSKICFHTVNPSLDGWRANIDCSGGEIEIENFPVHDVEIRQKDLLPVFQHFHHVQSDCKVSLPYRESMTLSSEACNQTKLDTTNSPSSLVSSDEILSTDSTTNTQKRDSPSLCCRSQSAKESDYYRANSVEDVNDKVGNASGKSLSVLSQIIPRIVPTSSQDSKSFDSNFSEAVTPDSRAPSESKGFCFGGIPLTDKFDSDNCVSVETSALSSCFYHGEQMADKNLDDTARVGGDHVQESYCRLSEPEDCHDSTEAITDAESNCSQYGRDKPYDDGDNEDMLGGVFAFSEDGES